MESILAEDLAPVNPLLRFVKAKIDRENRSVTATAFGMVKKTAVYREGIGCTLLPNPPHKLSGPPALSLPARRAEDPDRIPWPRGNLITDEALPPEVDKKKLAVALDHAFMESDPKHPVRTRAVIVVQRGRIIAERYAPGFTAQTIQHGWSMSKSITGALVGILVGEGRLSVDRPAPVPEWGAPSDRRGAITINDLLRMSSGIDFHNDLNPVGHRQLTLFAGIDAAAYTLKRPLSSEPGTVWDYSNANPLVLCHIMKGAVGGDLADYLAFPKAALFDKIGMRSALIEPDPYGTLIGTSFCWATPRDWARFGLFCLSDGVWERERILPKGWIAYATTPAPAAPLKNYGALFWLNAGADLPTQLIATKENPEYPPFPGLPADAYFCWGIYEQRITIIPSRSIVIVRMGLTHEEGAFPTEGFTLDVLSALH